MKKNLIVFVSLLSLCSPVYAIRSRKVTASVGLPIPTSYSITDGKSWVLSEIPGVYKHIKIINATASVIACHHNNSSKTAAPANDDGHDTYHLASGGAIYDNESVGANIFCRSDSGSTITSGSYYVEIW